MHLIERNSRKTQSYNLVIFITVIFSTIENALIFKV